jgi:hypothetical protein
MYKLKRREELEENNKKNILKNDKKKFGRNYISSDLN